MSRASSRPRSPATLRPFEEIRDRRRGPGLTAEDWADAALWSLEEGVDALSVERLARKLGVTKGSFYWHYAGRPALLQAALARWEQLATEEVIARLEELPTPQERLQRLLAVTFDPAPAGRLEVAIAAAAANPLIQPVVARVSRRRIDYLVSLYRALGVSAREARAWALQAYSTYVGLLHLTITSPETLRSHRERADYVKHLARVLMPE
ncbi:TetR/AcrR family transcriptional regulator [Myxococcus landrumensis]|uniref:TetR/AcrR family transcriptional regulator n=1 Tax=Myxococcus landrumensis TaxID=2813577 RepID=A0ABX7MWK0_9BACT|nr:TetR/AcrR family transcriptional regulator [Myxococcus landrumus]QSQ10812.1 TetR/AcrR family transcriptional regulator [Myxococcus landrumus]